MKPWKTLTKPDQVKIVAPNGSVRWEGLAYYGGSLFTIDDMSVDVRVDDEIRRTLPNGNEETFVVLDPKYFDTDVFGKHYQIKIGRPKIYESGRGGNYTVNVSGENSRVNINSTDYSTNTVKHGATFAELRAAIENGVADATQKRDLQAAVAALENARDKDTRLASYQRLISLAASHMTILAPFLGVLGSLVAG